VHQKRFIDVLNFYQQQLVTSLV